MRLVLMYDLNTTCEGAVKAYSKFHKWIISRGYIMVQFSVYMKPLNVVTKKDYEIIAIKKAVPKNGNIRLLCITEHQYQDMILLRGAKHVNEIINTANRRVKINDETL